MWKDFFLPTWIWNPWTVKWVTCVHKVLHSLERQTLMDKASSYNQLSVFVPPITSMLLGSSGVLASLHQTSLLQTSAQICFSMQYLSSYSGAELDFFYPQEWFFSTWEFQLAEVSSPGTCRQAEARRDGVCSSWRADKVQSMFPKLWKW